MRFYFNETVFKSDHLFNSKSVMSFCFLKEKSPARFADYSYHVIPLNKTISNAIQLVSTSFFQFYSLTQLVLLKAWFLYGRYVRSL